MLIPIYLRSFEKELEKAKKRGFDVDLLKQIMVTLINEKKLPDKHRNHKLDFVHFLATISSTL